MSYTLMRAGHQSGLNKQINPSISQSMYLLHGGQLLLEVVQFLQQLPLLQQVVLGLVERRVQQVHHVLHVLQLHGVLAGRAD